MEHYCTLGLTPVHASCACVGEDDYPQRAQQDCRRCMAVLRKTFGPEPDGAYCAVKGFLHDFGVYDEVVIAFDEDIPGSAHYACHCDDHLPTTWQDDQPIPQPVKDTCDGSERDLEDAV